MSASAMLWFTDVQLGRSVAQNNKLSQALVTQAILISAMLVLVFHGTIYTKKIIEYHQHNPLDVFVKFE